MEVDKVATTVMIWFRNIFAQNHTKDLVVKYHGVVINFNLIETYESDDSADEPSSWATLTPNLTHRFGKETCNKQFETIHQCNFEICEFSENYESVRCPIWVHAKGTGIAWHSLALKGRKS